MRDRRTPPPPGALLSRVLGMLMLAVLLTFGALSAVIADDVRSPTAAPAKASSGKAAADAKPVNAPAPAEVLNAARTQLEGLENRLASETPSEDELLEMRGQAGETATRIRAVVNDLSPRAAAINAQLAQLGPRPAEGAPPEAETTAREREERERNLAELQAGISLAEALLVQTAQLTTAINDHRRLVFANELFEQRPSLLSPWLWKEAMAGVPEALETARGLFGNWLGQAVERTRSGRAAATLASLAVWAGLYRLQRRFLPQLTHRDREEKNPERLRRVMKALGLIIGVTLPFVAAIITLFMALDAEGLTQGRMETIVVGLLLSVGFIFFMRALTRALLAPGLPSWRLFALDDDTAMWLYRASATLTVVLVVGNLLQDIVAAIDSNLALVALADGLAAFSFAVVMFVTLQGLRRRTKPIEEDFGPYVPSEPQLWSLLRAAAWLATFAIMLAALTGFIAFASFIVDQVVWVSTVVGLFFLLTTLIDEIAIEMPRRNSRVSLVLQTSVGLRRRTLEQIGILFSGVIKLILIALGVMLILAPWGVESNDVFSSLRSVQNGFTIGEVRMSPVEILGAIITFAVTLTVSRIIQRWLSARFLPSTGLDVGIRNSIATGVGYVGFFLAVGIACTQLGLSLDRVAIVAGALSVGIGFGLQSIVNNFVSGLILLWERPIKVGDWVVVGPEEGYVKRINVRATEIETFDRAAVIVPNSSLVSGTVKNWLHRDRLGRLIVSIGVSYTADPDEVRELMLACAKAHPQVLDTPAPHVLLMGFEPTMLRFELRCFIPNVENRLTVSSDLRFAVLRTLRERDLVPVRPMVWEEWRFGRATRADDEGGYNHHHGQDDTGAATT
ncbi:small-conductance mechanosensitive channel [Pseudochelatococcus lubricantis]|uniref:Small-conductance mechanosensitive channel n=1 Tax=Pseudochelatococcus lubricantis TaxID=1538102 RepID=A0ABX0V002_9HYPH|nr:DUF3772 domain-containing protein [Pseudochelatococcus lubricantis]NIJ58516.1 small-conductance mechanosensitive channel [Pseudochelatococcus lubricantis]